MLSTRILPPTDSTMVLVITDPDRFRRCHASRWAQVDRLALGARPDEPHRLLRHRHQVHRLAGRVQTGLDLTDVEEIGPLPARK